MEPIPLSRATIRRRRAEGGKEARVWDGGGVSFDAIQGQFVRAAVEDGPKSGEQLEPRRD